MVRLMDESQLLDVLYDEWMEAAIERGRLLIGNHAIADMEIDGEPLGVAQMWDMCQYLKTTQDGIDESFIRRVERWINDETGDDNDEYRNCGATGHDFAAQCLNEG